MNDANSVMPFSQTVFASGLLLCGKWHVTACIGFPPLGFKEIPKPTGRAQVLCTYSAKGCLIAMQICRKPSAESTWKQEYLSLPLQISNESTESGYPFPSPPTSCNIRRSGGWTTPCKVSSTSCTDFPLTFQCNT